MEDVCLPMDLGLKREGHDATIQVPVLSLARDEVLMRRLQSSVESLRLAVTLRVERRREKVLKCRQREQTLEEPYR